MPDFATAVRAALREDPDVILIGELRDLQTMHAAITAAEDRPPRSSAPCTPPIPWAPWSAWSAASPATSRTRSATACRWCCARWCPQRLVRRSDGKGRVPMVEVLVATNAVSNLIATGRTRQLHAAIESGTELGMQTFDQSLVNWCAPARCRARTPAA